MKAVSCALAMEERRGVTEWRHGWRIVLASLCGIAFGVTGLFFYSAGIFLKPIAAEFGWSRAASSTVPLAAALSLAVTAPFIGGIVDRYGTRYAALVSSIGLAVGFWMLSYAPANLGMYLGLVVVAVFLGAGASPVAYTRLINLHFVSARGSALGIAQTATGIAGAAIPALLIPFVARHGWRAGYQALALCALASLPLVLLLLKGVPEGSRSAVRPATLTEGALTLARRNGPFYIMASMLALAAIGVGGMIVHLVPMLSDAGLPLARVSVITAVLGLGIIVGRILTGTLVDRVFAPRVAFAAFGLAACGCWLLAVAGAQCAAAATALVGLAMGAEIDLISYLVARYYGMATYGRIYGWLYAIFMVGTSVGPIIAGASFDHFGNYRNAGLVLGGCLALAGVVSWALPKFPSASAA